MQRLLNQIIDLSRHTSDLTTIRVKCAELLRSNDCTWEDIHGRTIDHLIAIPPVPHHTPLDAISLATFLKKAVDAFQAQCDYQQWLEEELYADSIAVPDNVVDYDGSVSDSCEPEHKKNKL